MARRGTAGKGAPSHRPRAAMLRRRPVLPVEVVPVLIAVAIIGYVAGHSSGRGDSSERQTAKGADVALGYPAGWRTAARAPTIPGLAIGDATTIAPKGDAAKAGLVLGSLPAGELAPLPARFVARLPRLPVPEIVNLVETQAYKFAGLSVPGLAKQLTLFVIPNPGSTPMIFACYASVGRAREMGACEQSVATVTVVGEPQAYQLTPEARYAGKISTTISALDRLRATLKRELRPDVTVATAQRLASELSHGFASAGEALAQLQPSVAAQPVHTALTAAVARARAGYEALATAVGERSAERYLRAQKQVAGAEAEVDSTLSSFVLLGYSSTPQAGAGAAR
jgi:hypothetical protein